MREVPLYAGTVGWTACAAVSRNLRGGAIPRNGGGGAFPSVPALNRCSLRCRGTSLIRNNPTLGPYSRPVPRALWWSWGGVRMSEVPL